MCMQIGLWHNLYPTEIPEQKMTLTLTIPEVFGLHETYLVQNTRKVRLWLGRYTRGSSSEATQALLVPSVFRTGSMQRNLPRNIPMRILHPMIVPKE